MTRRSDSHQQKWTYRTVDFAVPADHMVELKEKEQPDNYLDVAKDLKTYINERDDDTNCNRCDRYSHQRVGSGTGIFGNKRTCGDYLNYNIIQNDQKSSGDIRRLAVTQTRV